MLSATVRADISVCGVHRFPKRPPVAQPLARQIGRRVEGGEAEARVGRIVEVGADAQRAVRRAEEAAGEIARLHVAGQVLQPDVGGHVARRRPQLAPSPSRNRACRLPARMAGHADVHAAVVPAVAVRHRADEREAIGHAGQSRQQLAEPHAGDAGGDRPIRSADVVGSVRLGIEAVDVAGAAVLDDEDARPAVACGVAAAARAWSRRGSDSPSAPMPPICSNSRRLNTVVGIAAPRYTRRASPAPRCLDARILPSSGWFNHCSTGFSTTIPFTFSARLPREGACSPSLGRRARNVNGISSPARTAIHRRSTAPPLPATAK